MRDWYVRRGSVHVSSHITSLTMSTCQIAVFYEETVHFVTILGIILDSIPSLELAHVDSALSL